MTFSVTIIQKLMMLALTLLLVVSSSGAIRAGFGKLDKEISGNLA
jgi:hypothetical protein